MRPKRVIICRLHRDGLTAWHVFLRPGYNTPSPAANILLADRADLVPPLPFTVPGDLPCHSINHRVLGCATSYFSHCSALELFFCPGRSLQWRLPCCPSC